MLTRAAVVAGVCLLAGSTVAQSPAPPVFDAKAALVLVDVVVTDRKDQPVLDLTAADFAVFEDGARRDILSFAAFGAAATKAIAQAGPSAAPDQAAPQFVPAATVLLIDEGHLSLDETTKLGPVLTQVLRELGRRQGWLLVLAPFSDVAFAGRLPADAAGLAEAAGHIRGQRTRSFTMFPMTDAEALEIEEGYRPTEERVTARFAHLNPEPAFVATANALVKMRAIEIAVEVRRRRHNTFGAIRLGCDWLARQPGRHSIILMTSGFPHEPKDPEFDRLTTQSLRVNAPIHFLDVASVSSASPFETIAHRYALPQGARVAPSESVAAAAGSERLALDSGGLRVSGSDERGLQRVLDTTRTYYVLGYDPPRQKKPGYRKIKVEVKGKGLRVLARRGYFDDAPTPAPRADRR
jgi:VWFA-related protein